MRPSQWPTIVSWMAMFLCSVCGGCQRAPFQMVPVEGTITYEDGSVVPAKRFQIWFTSQAPPADPRTFPRPASAFVDLATGAFANATTVRYGDGLVKGIHKVHLDLEPANLVPQEYVHLGTTPLEIATADSPLRIKIPKPKR